MKLCGTGITVGERYRKIIDVLIQRGYLYYDSEGNCVDYRLEDSIQLFSSRLIYKLLVLYFLGYANLEVEGYTVLEWLVKLLSNIDPSLVQSLV
ncbi:MAG: hypothetical protein GXO26_04570 [Crenarchaeota archaeon]|nr:hypothetical protein [Thermoproteota archaeon]